MCVFFTRYFSKVLLIGHWFISIKRLTAMKKSKLKREREGEKCKKKMHICSVFDSISLSFTLPSSTSFSLAHTTPAAIDGFILEMYLFFVAICATHGTAYTCASVEWEKIGKIGKRENKQMKQEKNYSSFSPYREEQRWEDIQ